jgi:hypothetical protein
MKLKLAVAVACALGTLGLAAPAQASCDTEVGDMCKFMRAMCDSTEPTHKIRDKVINCEGW